MPRYPGGDYYLPPGTEAAPDTTIESTKYNVFTADVETEFNNMSDLINLALSDPVTGLPTKVSKAGDTMTGALILSGDPTAPLQAATKQYAVARAGDTMTGQLTLPTGPAAANAVRKDYVDAADTTLAGNITTGDALKVAKAGDTMTGHLTLPTGPAAANAVRKDYVDTAVGAYLPLAGGTVTGELVAGAGYLRFTTSGSIGYIQWTGAANFNVGGNGIWHSGNFTPSSYVSNGRLAYVTDTYISSIAGMIEPYGGAVVTGVNVTGPPTYTGVINYVRFRYMQLFTSGWFTIGYV